MAGSRRATRTDYADGETGGVFTNGSA